jgi:segregation and condensation protein B
MFAEMQALEPDMQAHLDQAAATNFAAEEIGAHADAVVVEAVAADDAIEDLESEIPPHSPALASSPDAQAPSTDPAPEPEVDAAPGQHNQESNNDYPQ